MYRENYINSLRSELLEMVETRLTPLALKYGYSNVPLETNIKWQPLVLILGNYSSGKSTLINEFLGGDIQATGQAPTDDSFTVITHVEPEFEKANVRVIEEKDGKFLLNGPEYPFEMLKKHGQRFASHFRLKKVNSPFVQNFSIIDTPGMLDSITERDRGYKYQEVIGDLAQIADLVLVLFDPHKAGTVREAYTSLRDTLPAHTFEDRVIFVLNRIDECSSMIDLLRVYGTLCWNLSQMTGRKDIPHIHLTYSTKQMLKSKNESNDDSNYLNFLNNQRDDLQNAILKAPCYRLDHLATFVETHSERLTHLLEAIISYRKKLNLLRIKLFFVGLLFSFICSGGLLFIPLISEILLGLNIPVLIAAIGSAAGLFMLLWLAFVMKFFKTRFHQKCMKNIDSLTPLENQNRHDIWDSVKNITKKFLDKSLGRFSLKEARQAYSDLTTMCQTESKDIREALNELSTIRHDDVPYYMKNKEHLDDAEDKIRAINSKF